MYRFAIINVRLIPSRMCGFRVKPGMTRMYRFAIINVRLIPSRMCGFRVKPGMTRMYRFAIINVRLIPSRMCGFRVKPGMTRMYRFAIINVRLIPSRMCGFRVKPGMTKDNLNHACDNANLFTSCKRPPVPTSNHAPSNTCALMVLSAMHCRNTSTSGKILFSCLKSAGW